MMVLAQAMAVPRDIRVAAVPREDPTRRATRAVVEDPVQREDLIPRDIKVLDRMTVPREAVMVPREAPNLALNLDPNLMTVKMEEVTEVATVTEVEMAVELVAMPTEEMTMTATPTR
jgi:hypothetical protein